jgi:hypothetical protein
MDPVELQSTHLELSKHAMKTQLILCIFAAFNGIPKTDASR